VVIGASSVVIDQHRTVNFVHAKHGARGGRQLRASTVSELWFQAESSAFASPQSHYAYHALSVEIGFFVFAIEFTHG
jgi:hypothetical protein